MGARVASRGHACVMELHEKVHCSRISLGRFHMGPFSPKLIVTGAYAVTVGFYMERVGCHAGTPAEIKPRL